MSEQLTVFQAELDRLEREDRWDAPEYDYLAAKVEELKAAEQSKPSAPKVPANTDEPESDSVAALQRDMQAAAVDMDRLSDQQVAELLGRYNAMAAADRPQPEVVDLQALQRDMLQAGADPNFGDEQARELTRRYNVAVRQGLKHHTSGELRAELEGADLGTRMLAADELHDRGELEDEQADAVVAAYNEAVAETTAAVEAAGGIDIAALPTELRPAAEAILAAKKTLETPADPVDAALHQLNQAIRGMKPPTVAEQLAELGLEARPELGAQAEPEPEQVGNA